MQHHSFFRNLPLYSFFLLLLKLSLKIQNDPRVEHQFKRLEDLVQGRTRSFTVADGCLEVRHEFSGHKLPTHKPTLRKGTFKEDLFNI